MRKEHKTILSLLFFCLQLSYSNAQSVVAKAQVDSSKVLLGQAFTLEITLINPKSQQIQWPYISDSIGALEVVQAGPIDTMPVEDASVLLRRQKITLIAFDSGKYVIPSYSFKYSFKGTEQVVETDPLQISVFLVPVDTTKAFRDIHTVVQVPYDWFFIFIIIGCVLLLILIIGAIILYFQKQKKKDDGNFTPEIKRPAHEIALEAIELLKAKELWQNGHLKKFYTELTDILRIYIYDRWNVNAMELTSDEILSNHFVKIIATNNAENLAYVLRLADLVKFAKAQPLANEHELSIVKSVQFIEGTKIEDPQINPMINKEGENGNN